jgi:hypothetical protein
MEFDRRLINLRIDIIERNLGEINKIVSFEEMECE